MNKEGLRFLLFWLVPVVTLFSLIGGKQPHYLVPLLPGVVLLLAIVLQRLETRRLAQTLSVIVAIFISGQMIASTNFFKSYDLEPIADIVSRDPSRDLAFVRNYHAEIGFLARREKPLDDRQTSQIDDWFEEHPNGWAVIRYKDDQDIKKYDMIASFPYRGKRVGVFQTMDFSLKKKEQTHNE